MFFPEYRARRLRRNEALRSMVRETFLRPEDLIYPMFSAFGKNIRKEILSMPGIYQQSIEHIVTEAREVYELGIPAVILFGIPEEKDALGQDAYAENGIIQETIRAIKAEVPKLLVITDVCMCEYTDHGHCGVIKDGDVDNDETLKLLAAEALSHARAGADIVAPSDMMDGRVAAIREVLDANGFSHIPVMSYSAKFASCFYGPFREAAHSAPAFGDRRAYQLPAAARGLAARRRHARRGRGHRRRRCHPEPNSGEQQCQRQHRRLRPGHRRVLAGAGRPRRRRPSGLDGSARRHPVRSGWRRSGGFGHRPL